MKRPPAMRVKIEIVVDHGVHRIASLCIKERQRRRNKGPSPSAACLRSDMQRMDRVMAELREIKRKFGRKAFVDK